MAVLTESIRARPNLEAVRRGVGLFAILAASAATSLAGAAAILSIPGRSNVTAVAADADQVAYATVATSSDCARVFIWDRLTRHTVQLGKKKRCGPGSGSSIGSLTLTGGRALWLDTGSSKLSDWRLWTATTTKTTPHRLQVVPSTVDDPQPIVLGTAGGGLLPYAIGTTVTVLRANGTLAFAPWEASGRVVALAARNGHVAVAQEGSRVTVLDSKGGVASVDLYQGSVSKVALTAKGLLVQRDGVLELRQQADAREYTTTAGATLADADGKLAAWSDGKGVHLLRLPEGTQAAMYPGSYAAIAGSRLYVANGRTITVRTIR